jgi:hypothetical protein
MKRLLMNAASVLAFAGAASAGELPRDYLGRWCSDGYTDGRMWRVINQFKQDCDVWVVVQPRGLRNWDNENGICRFLSIRKVGKFFAVTARCHAEDGTYTTKIELSASGDFLTLKEESE